MTENATRRVMSWLGDVGHREDRGQRGLEALVGEDRKQHDARKLRLVLDHGEGDARRQE